MAKKKATHRLLVSYDKRGVIGNEKFDTYELDENNKLNLDGAGGTCTETVFRSLQDHRPFLEFLTFDGEHIAIRKQRIRDLIVVRL